jgi:hypothetical protein
MPLISLNPLRWDWSGFVRLSPRRKPEDMPHISDKIARDIGLSADELAELRHVWPSDSKDRPLL